MKDIVLEMQIKLKNCLLCSTYRKNIIRFEALKKQRKPVGFFFLIKGLMSKLQQHLIATDQSKAALSSVTSHKYNQISVLKGKKMKYLPASKLISGMSLLLATSSREKGKKIISPLPTLTRT